MPLAVLVLTGAIAVACGSDKSRSFDEDPNLPGGSNGQTPNGVLGDGDGGKPELKAVGTLTGTVYAPEGTVPIANALIYLGGSLPAPIPDHAYCDKCVQLPAGTPFTYSKADGTFELPIYSPGQAYLIVQKGQFRRARPITTTEGTQAVDKPLTTFPGASNSAVGDDIPRIGVAGGGFDKIEISLKKLGLTQFDRYGQGLFEPKGLPPAVSQFTWDLVKSQETLSKYHIVLLPCGFTGLECKSLPTSGQQKMLRDYVEGGGKVYVTDYSYEVVRQIWPGFITWKDGNDKELTDMSQWGVACQPGQYDLDGKAEDPGLGAWLSAIGESSFKLKGSYTLISKVTPQQGKDADGNPTTITPKVWMSSVKGPQTVTFDDQCGRVLFSTYHAEGDDDTNLLAQEKALLYILLEASVCIGPAQQPH
ncbi:Tryptophan synthase alpha chain [Labilithrix luteola]|uniref:Tryptophan synthase alpha chain n=1 Tax=Labilithrix luteola TaxID=1391654 RepID=A0A0K1PZF9_9BACT|nr:Tryptophan synthase alpha chain [Labilithrix luteola]